MTDGWDLEERNDDDFRESFGWGIFWCVRRGRRVRVFCEDEGRTILSESRSSVTVGINQSLSSNGRFITTTRIPRLLVPYRPFFCSFVGRAYRLNSKKKAFTVNLSQKGSGIATYRLTRKQLQELRQLPKVEGSSGQKAEMEGRANTGNDTQEGLRSQEEIQSQVRIRTWHCH
jgi:hypothetical protein